jgi:hypothetical protein
MCRGLAGIEEFPMSREQREDCAICAQALPWSDVSERWSAWWEKWTDATFLYFYVAWGTIGLVSAYDAYLVVLYQPAILTLERNPLCRLLITWDPHGLSYFLGAKTLGTLVVLSVLIAMHTWFRPLALRVVTGVALFQAGLVCYMYLARY